MKLLIACFNYHIRMEQKQIKIYIYSKDDTHKTTLFNEIKILLIYIGNRYKNKINLNKSHHH